MSKQCMHRREKKRQQQIAKYADAREKARAVVNNPNASFEEKLAATAFLEKSRDSSKVRQSKRCPFTGRVHGTYTKKIWLGRGILRRAVMRGDVPGVVKASW